ncbi:MAG: flagellar hook-associated protein FlgK [Oscillospiraceae bacterium]|nr:flagellar hook-associated protein FlgK [Oscillospiraceae bacterium]
MTRATFFGLEIGKTGLTMSQLGLDVTAHNIANVDTKGYTRQRIVSTAYDPFTTIGRALPVDQARVGGGVHVMIHDQIRSAYLDRRYRTENTSNAYWQQRVESLSYLESYFDNVNEETSLNYALANFFRAMKVLAEDPVEGAPRTLLQTAGKDMVQQMNLVYEGLIDLQDIQNTAVTVTVERINRIADEIALLNKEIYGFEVTGYVANDLRDKRNVLLDELSSLADIEYRDYPDGKGNTKFEVSMGGKVLVDHVDTWRLGVMEVPNPIPELAASGEAPVWQVVWMKEGAGGGLEPDPANPLALKGGELKAYIDMRDGDGVGSNPKGIPYYIEMLNNLARALVQEINAVHAQGWTDHPVSGSNTGIVFFEDLGAGTLTYLYEDPDNPALITGAVYTVDQEVLKNITAGNIRLSDEIEENAYNIACSSSRIVKHGESQQLQRGNNENMNALYALFLKKDIALGTVATGGISIGSFDGYVTSIRFDVGNLLDNCIKTADNCNTLTVAAENQRLAVAGVSLDEEMTNLIKYQHAYNGAARVITAMDDALDRLINGTGRVGL